jgi:hypothetical protein
MAKTGQVLLDRSTRGSKIVYGGIHRYLVWHHPYRNIKRFNGKTRHREQPPIVLGLDVMRYATWRQSYLDLGGKEDSKDDLVLQTGVKRLSAFYKLPY